MTNELPPNPVAFRDLKTWARQFYEFYLTQTRVDSENDPLPLLLAHRTGGIMERASTAGILLYDPTTDEAVSSNGDDWVPLSRVPSYTATQLADAAAECNTMNKSAGRIVYDSTNETLAVANGSGDTDTWSRLTVAATVTPS